MGDLTITTFVTLDGVMQGPGGANEDTSEAFQYGGWVMPHFSEEIGKEIDVIFSRADAFLLGRTTYDIFEGSWGKVTDPDNELAYLFNRLPKFVASRKQSVFTWDETAHVRDVVKEVPEIKQRFKRELQVHGSAGLAQTLIEHDLIDEYRLFIFPVVIGSGKRLFGGGAMPANLKLVRSQPTSTGVVYCVYRRGGIFKTREATVDD